MPGALSLAGLFVAACAPARPPAAEPILGRYRVEGMQAGGTSYTGTAVIEAGSGSGPVIEWRIGEDLFQATIEADLVRVRFAGPGGGGGEYRRLGADHLEGRWWSKDSAETGHETLRRLADPWVAPEVVTAYEPAAGVVRIGAGPDDVVARTARGYTLTLPSGRAPAGVAVFFDGWPAKADSVPPAKGSFDAVALPAGVAVLRVTTGNPVDFLFDDRDVAAVLDQVRAVLGQRDLLDCPLLFTGLSLGGTRALRAAIGVRRDRKSPLRLAAVAIVDAPLDMVRMWNGETKAWKDGFHPASTGEGRWVRYLLDAYLGSPKEARRRYVDYSPFVYGEPGGGNAVWLRELPVRAYHEPDVDWWIAHRRKSYYQMNSIDLAGLIAELRLAGNDRAELVTSHAARDGYQFESSPHTWSVVDNADLIRWFLAQAG